MSRPSIISVLLLALLPALGCAQSSTQAEEVLVLEVAPETVSCVGEAQQRCLQVRTGPDEAWRNFYDTIEGFTHEEGYRYLIEVGRREATDLLADASAYRYRLIEILSREPAG